jgi:hypothetical protein
VIFARWRRTRAFVKTWRERPYTRFAMAYVPAMSLLYGLAFSNLGIIVRQRVVILPLLLALVSAPAVARPVRARRLQPAFAGHRDPELRRRAVKPGVKSGAGVR